MLEIRRRLTDTLRVSTRFLRFLKSTAFLLLLVPLCRGAEDTNAVEAVVADENAGWESVFSEDNRIPFHINLYMADSLYYELIESGEYKGAFYTSIFSEKRRLTGRLGAKLHLDAAAYNEKGAVTGADNEVSVRRFRVNTFGRAFFFSPLTYGVEFGLADNTFYFNDGYVWFHEVPYISSARFGIFKAPFSMASLESSSGIPLMEDASPVTAFAPGDMLGIQLGGAIPSERATLYAGWFADVNDSENRDASQSYSRFIARGTWLGRETGGTNGTRRIHLGTSVSALYAKDEGVQYRSRPESYLAPFLIDTGPLGGDQAYVLGLEGGWQNGPLLIQSELIQAYADNALGQTLRFHGFYVQSSFMLTGETRGYNRRNGFFVRIEPRRDFSFRERSWGAWEWAARYSHTDLSDESVQGGIMSIVSTGLNLYLSKRNRIMFDVGYADVRDRLTAGLPADGDLFFVQGRFQVDL